MDCTPPAPAGLPVAGLDRARVRQCVVMTKTWWLPALGVLAAVTLTGCGSDDPEFDYSSARVAPDLSAYADNENSDTEPEGDDALVELDLDSGATVVMWIDPDDKRKVFQQHSDPDDDTAWTEPELLYEAGDGCLFIEADTNGEVVAATLGCYEVDAFIQQAPDTGQAVVTEDLEKWDVDDRGEFFDVPVVADDGEVSWVQG